MCVTHVPEHLLPLTPVCTGGEGRGEGGAKSFIPPPLHPLPSREGSSLVVFSRYIV
jgi:hypothetical protein